MKNLSDLAKVIRSKNCSPFQLTFDIIFIDRQIYKVFKKDKLISQKLISLAFNVPISKISDITYFDPACAIKFVIDRSISSGSVGDSDVYGAQQHAPLLSLIFNI
ncbi:DUF4387 domain-containing protein [Piscirickettsia litoralis]|uniref:Acyl-CoA synthetase n=1 Tax=Piscirickettsia litoralis TaxID=1891921 RepID=A0ABX3A311_9GAMM|nr:DUF4387 domain-containing protein [Piscirickettsia litoralis]ODN41765.1 acyl-CoA synthetase [Piscirickettsia litoralis]